MGGPRASRSSATRLAPECDKQEFLRPARTERAERRIGTLSNAITLFVAPADAHSEDRMSRDEIIATLLSYGAVALIHMIEDVEAGRVRRVHVPPIPGDRTFGRELIAFLRSRGAEVEFSAAPDRSRDRQAG
jgi:hypothetical protein